MPPSVVLARPIAPRRPARWLALAGAAAALTSLGLMVGALPATALTSTLAGDSFSRQVSNAWGSADTGGSYTLVRATSTEVGVTGSVGYEKLTPGVQFTAALKSVNVADVSTSDTISLAVAPDAVYDVQHRWDVRQQSTGNAYSGRIRLTSDGAAHLGVSRIVGTSGTWLAGVALPFDVPPGHPVRIELEASGASPVVVKMRAWLEGSTLPAWQVSYSDSSASRLTAPGFVSMTDYGYLASSPVTVNHDNVYVGPPGTAPAPSASPTPTTPTATATVVPPSDPPTPSAAERNRGSAPVGTARYTVPAGAFFVSPNGNDSNPGTEAAPVRTVMAAVPKIPSNGAGTIVLRGGTYHQSVKVESNRSATIQNYPGETVWFDGSVPVTNWVKDGSTWVSSGWTTEFSNTMGHDAAFRSIFLDTNKLAAYPDQVFVGQTPLRQVATAAEVVPGTFFVSYSADTITIGSDPSGAQVRASDLAQAIFLSGKNSIVQGIGVRRYANPYETKGAVRVINTGGGVRNVVVEDSATLGLALSNSGKTVDHVTITRAGMVGIGGYMIDGSTITNSVFSDNNTQVFRAEPEAGGMKITASRGVTVDNVEANGNIGATGIWFDVSSYQINVVNSSANGNSKYGIEMELTGHGIVANNEAMGGEAGIIVFDSHDFKVFNNDVGNNTQYGIKLAQDHRRQSQLGTFADGRDPRRANEVDPTVTWITANVQVSNNVFGRSARSMSSIYALDARTNRAVDTWNLTVGGNLFNKARVLSSEQSMVLWGKGDNVTVERYETPSTLASAKNGSWRNAQLDTAKVITQMSEDKTRYAAVALPVPTDVADVAALTAGSQVLGSQQLVR